MIAINTNSQSNTDARGMRPVDLPKDLAQLADLIELVFRETMDENGRAAIQEMRYLSQISWGLRILNGINETALGLGLGFVWIEDGRLIGNASLFPANWHRDLGEAWLIANVGTHPDYRRKGIARQLVVASMEWIKAKGADYAILQVDYDNQKAIDLYEDLGFVKERAFTLWTRSAMITASPEPENGHFITQAGMNAWKAIYELHLAARPNELGGIGWLRPLHIRDFRPSLRQALSRFFSFSSKEQLIIRDAANEEILAYLEVERNLVSRNRLTLLRREAADISAAAALLGNILRRYRGSGFALEHPYDDTALNDLLLQYRFRPHRSIWHMRYHF